MHRPPFPSPPFSLAILALTTGLAFAATAKAGIESRFSPQDDLRSFALNELGSVKHRVDVMLPSLREMNESSDTAAPLLRSLIKLAKDGRQVRVLTSDKAARGKNCQPCDSLEKAGVDLRFVEPIIQHNFLVIDGPRSRSSQGSMGRVMASTGSFTKPKAGQSLVLAKGEGDLAILFQDEFNFVWSRARDYGDRAKAAAVQDLRVPNVKVAVFTSANMTPIEVENSFQFTPTLDRKRGIGVETLSVAIHQAYDTIDIATRSLANPTLYAALERALARGTRVRIVLPKSQWSGNVDAQLCSGLSLNKKAKTNYDECLALRGAEVAYAKAVHGTTLVIDGRLAMVGSLDLSGNRELGRLGHILSLQGEAAKPFGRQVADLFASALKLSQPQRPDSSLNARDDQAAHGLRPAALVASNPGCGAISPISYSYEEMMRLREAARRSNCR